MYLDLGKRVFRKRKFIPMRAWSKYPDKPLHAELTRAFGNRTFGSPDLRTLLLIVMHNRTTNSPYPLSNNPKATYNTGESKTRDNLSVRLVRPACSEHGRTGVLSAVPAQFRRQGSKEVVDGGITAHNNPALQLFLAATLPEYKLEWPTGPDKLLLTSIGTGFPPGRLNNLSRLRRHIIYVATNTPTGLMFAAANHNDVVCRALGQFRFGPFLDNELQYLAEGLPHQMFAYARYNIELSPKYLEPYNVTVDPRGARPTRRG